MIIFLMGFSSFFFGNKEIQSLHLGEKIINIHKNKISLYIHGSQMSEYIVKEGIRDFRLGDVNGDSQAELIILTGRKKDEYGEELIVLAIEEEIIEISRKDFSHINPWKIAVGDIDGDGIDEISIGVYKESPLHPVMAKRPFIYSYKDGSIQPKWRGSRLSKPFTDYDFYDLDNDGIDELIAIEIMEDNSKVINSYKWKGFGLEGYMQSRTYNHIDQLEILEEGVFVQVKEGKDIYKGLIKVVDNNLIIERVN